MEEKATTEAQRHRGHSSPIAPLCLWASVFACFLFASAGLASIHLTPKFRNAGVYECVEWQIDLTSAYDNPFDPDQIAVDGAFTGPGGQKLLVPGFWVPKPLGHFFLRFAAIAPGQWTLVVHAKDRAGEQVSAPISFDVQPSKGDGFIHVAANHRYFQFSSGRSFFALGLNLAWTNTHNVSAYETWFAHLSAAGGNFARVWLAHPSEQIEDRLGVYDQSACAFYDHLLQSAQDHGIYCTLTISNYRDLILRDNWGPADWTRSPYNAANGGPAATPEDFFTNPACQRLYRNRLRYLVARYGAYSSCFCWEFFNEQTFTLVPIAPAWTQAMARYVQSIDPYDHPVSTSFGANDQYAVWKMPEIRVTQEHIYPGSDIPDGAPVFASGVYSDRQFDKPCLIAESGIAGEGPDGRYDPSGKATNFHNGLWSTMMAGAAGGASIWWWDNYVEPGNLWSTFSGAARFAKQINWSAAHFEPMPLVAMNANPGAETFSDILVTAGQGWGRSHGKTVEVEPNGQTMLMPPQFIYGPRKVELQMPTVLSINMPRAGQMIVRAAKVSDFGILRVYVDGQPTADFAFSALPASTQPGGTTTRNHEGMYQATFQKDCAVNLSAGPHTVKLADIAGDWLAIKSIRFTHARSSKYADLFVYALTDKSAGRTIAWLHDPESNWRNDADGKAPRTIPAAVITVPADEQTYRVQWWDTYDGKVIQQSDQKAAGQLILAAPPVQRDMAVSIFRTTESAASSIIH
jgi:Domain of unknown function (DUF5060)